MVMRFGMSDKLGPRVFGRSAAQPFLAREFTTAPDYSADIAHAIDEEIRGTIAVAHRCATEILRTHRDSLERLSAALLERETIDREQFLALLAGPPEEEAAPALVAANAQGVAT
jgi:cell division protease FtsH